jgi:predicted TIM-barrel fold metal-dependent hydrolase
MIIDVHAYLDGRPGREPTPAAVRTYATAAGVDVLLVCNRAAAARHAGGSDLDEATANHAGLLASAPCGILRVLYWVRPGEFDSNAHAFAGALRSAPFVGAFFAPALNDFDARDVELLAPYLTTLTHLGVPAVFRVASDERASVDAVAALARRYSNLPIILSAPALGRNWATAALAARRASRRLYVDTTGAPPEEIGRAVKDLGAPAILYGTGTTVCSAQGAETTRETLDVLRGLLTPADFARVTGGNAQELFRLVP